MSATGARGAAGYIFSRKRKRAYQRHQQDELAGWLSRSEESILARLNGARRAICIGCGCTDAKACQVGCSWLEVDRKRAVGVCSSCPGELERYRRIRALGRAP